MGFGGGGIGGGGDGGVSPDQAFDSILFDVALQDAILERGAAGRVDVNATPSGGGDGALQADSFVGRDDGAAASPIFRGQDANTGFYFPNSGGEVSLSQQGTDVWLVDAAGGVFRNGNKHYGWFYNQLTSPAGTVLNKNSHLATIHTNDGAAALAPYTLPNLINRDIGTFYWFVVTDADGIEIAADGTDLMRVLGTNSTATTGRVTSTTVGDTILMAAVSTTQWVALVVNGTWSVT